MLALRSAGHFEHQALRIEVPIILKSNDDKSSIFDNSRSSFVVVVVDYVVKCVVLG